MAKYGKPKVSKARFGWMTFYAGCACYSDTWDEALIWVEPLVASVEKQCEWMDSWQTNLEKIKKAIEY